MEGTALECRDRLVIHQPKGNSCQLALSFTVKLTAIRGRGCQRRIIQRVKHGAEIDIERLGALPCEHADPGRSVAVDALRSQSWIVGHRAL